MGKNMKVLFMTNIPAPYRVDFFNKLTEKCDLTVLFEKRNDNERNEEWYKNNKYNFNFIFLPTKNYIQKLFKILNDNYDLIIIGVYSTKLAAISRFYLKFKKRKYIISADGGFAGDKTFITKFIKTFFISSASYWLSSGNETTKYLKYYGAKEENIYNFHFTSLNKNEILTEPIKYSKKLKLRRKAGYNYKRIFISVGQIVYRKGYDILLEALKNENFKDTAFIIAGVGNKLEEYKKYIKDNNLKNVFFVGFKDKKELLELYNMSDVFFFPTREDIWGLVINEAMAYGLPIISSNKALASLELIDEDYLFNLEDKDKLLKLLKEYNSKNEKDLYRIGNKNLNIIKNYNIEQMVYDHIKIFEEIIKRENNQ